MSTSSTLVPGLLGRNAVLKLALLLVWLCMAASGQAPAEAPCCKTKSFIVPIVAYIADVGLPVLLLIASYLVLRARKAKLQAVTSTTTLPLLDTEQEEKPAFASVPIKRNSVGHLVDTNLPNLAKKSLDWLTGKSGQDNSLKKNAEERLAAFAAADATALLAALGTTPAGLTETEAEARLKRVGPNKVSEAKPPSMLRLVANSILQPFNALMLVVALVTVCPPTSDKRTFTLIMVLLVGAIVLRFFEEVKSVRTAQNLQTGIDAKVHVVRDGKTVEVSLKDTAPGDIVSLSGNDLVPGDVRILAGQNLQVGMSSLTGEALPVAKSAGPCSGTETALEHSNIALMSTSVISGSAQVVILATGDNTYVAGIAATLPSGHAPNAFDYAVRRVVYLFIIFLGFMCPIVIVLSGVSTGSWSGAVALGLSVAVGLSPQMMPIIITANLSRGANVMRKQKTVIRRLDAVQNLGAMDVLCSDKTGTLTMDEVVLVRHLDAASKDSLDCLKLGYANSYFQAGKGNVMDEGVKRYAAGMGVCAEVEAAWAKLDEVPFDFERRMLSVVLRPTDDLTSPPLLVCKGAVEEVLLKCTHLREGDTVMAISEQQHSDLAARCASMNKEGLRVLALATRTMPKVQASFSREDEADLLFQGFLVFLDPPKLSALPAIHQLTKLGINIKVLTGDNLLVAKRVCQDLNIPAEICVTGAQLATLEDASLQDVVEHATIFAKVTPQQKMTIINTLQKKDHICGFMGDGTNDALALRKADVGICVDSGTDVAKESADMIMLDKDLEKLAFGVKTGRVTYGNTIKYIKFASSSSFGNTFSILAGAAWLPFNPLAPIQVLTLNMLYNISQIAIPWDTMDESFVKKPKRWSAKFLGLYMLVIGPTSSIFDMTTFLIAWYVFKANNASDAATIRFQSIWLLESLMTQTFIVHLLRTERIPFLQSRAAWPLMVSSFGTMVAGVVITYLPKVNTALNLGAPPPLYYAYLVATVAAYCFTVQVFKIWYIRVFNSWL